MSRGIRPAGDRIAAFLATVSHKRGRLSVGHPALGVAATRIGLPSLENRRIHHLSDCKSEGSFAYDAAAASDASTSLKNFRPIQRPPKAGTLYSSPWTGPNLVERGSVP